MFISSLTLFVAELSASTIEIIFLIYKDYKIAGRLSIAIYLYMCQQVFLKSKILVILFINIGINLVTNIFIYLGISFTILIWSNTIFFIPLGLVLRYSHCNWKAWNIICMQIPSNLVGIKLLLQNDIQLAQITQNMAN